MQGAGETPAPFFFCRAHCFCVSLQVFALLTLSRNGNAAATSCGQKKMS
jgi:hypothetical protein